MMALGVILRMSVCSETSGVSVGDDFGEYLGASLGHYLLSPQFSST